MDVSPRSLAGGTDENEPVGDSWIIPSSSGHLVPRRHNPDPAKAVVNPAPGSGGIQRYFKPKSKSNDHINGMPEPVASASPAQQPGRLVKQRSATEDVKSRRRRSAKLLVSKQSASVEDPREQRQQSAQTPTRSPNQKASDKGLKERRRRTAALLLSSQDRIAETAISDTSVGGSIRSEPRSPESSDGDDSFIVSDGDSPVATAELGYNYLDTCTAISPGFNGIGSAIKPECPSPDGEPVITGVYLGCGQQERQPVEPLPVGSDCIASSFSFQSSAPRRRPASVKPAPVASPASALLQATEDSAVSFFQHAINVKIVGHQEESCSCAICTKPIAFLTLTACFKDGTAAPLVFCGTCCTSPCNCVCAFCDHVLPQCLCRHHGSQAPL